MPGCVPPLCALQRAEYLRDSSVRHMRAPFSRERRAMPTCAGAYWRWRSLIFSTPWLPTENLGMSPRTVVIKAGA